MAVCLMPHHTTHQFAVRRIEWFMESSRATATRARPRQGAHGFCIALSTCAHQETSRQHHVKEIRKMVVGTRQGLLYIPAHPASLVHEQAFVHACTLQSRTAWTSGSLPPCA